jgi:hypothetical protein
LILETLETVGWVIGGTNGAAAAPDGTALR